MAGFINCSNRLCDNNRTNLCFSLYIELDNDGKCKTQTYKDNEKKKSEEEDE